ncbi:glucosamine-6-phosphate isomerase/6-phosphogluconolactonase domain protein [Leptospira interrogans serovar Icterohaemorrhagiae str. Verdun HP]|uniref:Glucosamine-6-phosphate isomerase/6-phosphogluconolactonase domain protein n=1 Tax=Leptospira interrogans serovar Icterohaemorrhagiae str. Verdun HP TaxID=1049910 RepID=M6RUK1_LEPIR|nr:glucosamine-6-phosphate isomerase/6-phosphogluconolactonase domain protein [Leptospira interrogans serovar Icterohaemorrhagiae str. Verdun HP]
MHIIEFSNERDFLDHCLDRIKEISANKIQTKSSFHIVLTGGDTAKLLYSELKHLKTDWSKWFFISEMRDVFRKIILILIG